MSPRNPAGAANAKDRLLDAALHVIRAKGYSATTVDDLCAEAKVTKGAFFHHFKSKEDLGVCAAQHWDAVTGAFFASAPYHQLPDPLERVLAYIDLRREMLQGPLAAYTCLVGTMVQETYQSSPAIRDACHASIFGHASTLEADLEAAKKLYAPQATWSVPGLALHFMAVIQGSFILAKSDAKSADDPGIAAQSIQHLRHYVELLFSHANARHHSERKPSA